MKMKFVNYRILIIVCAMIIFSGIALLHNLSVFADSNDDVTIKNQEESNISERMTNDLSPKETVEINEKLSDNTDNNSTLVQAKDNNPIDEGINNAANTKENPKMGTVFNVGSAGLNLRGEPSTIGGGVILVMPENSTVKILGERNVDGRLWYNVDFNGYLGWAVADYIKINDNHGADNNTKPGSDINLSQNERERIIWDYLKSKGLSDYAISGIMGNLYAESGLNPRNVENAFELNSGYNDNSYTEAVDNGSYNNFVNDGAGYGLAQWTYYTFKQELLNRARAERLSIGDLNLQLKFLWDWIQQDYSAFQSLTSSNSVQVAADIFLKQYERPYDQSEAALIKRASYGEMYFNKYKSTDTGQDDENQSEYNVSGEFFYDSDGKLRYKLSNGSYPKVGFIEKDGRKFFTYGNGYIYTNEFITFGSKIMYYMGSDGSMQVGKFRDNEGMLRYSLPDGNLIGSNGWKEDAGGRYFAYNNGYLYTNEFITFGSKIMYYMGSDGSMQVGKFRNNEGMLRYSLPDGNLIGSNGWKEDVDGKYFAYNNGYLYTNEFITFGSKIMYYMGADGSMQVGKFMDNAGRLRYSLPDGNLIGSNGWKEDVDGKYFAYNNGYLYTNEFITFGPKIMYYMGSDGSMQIGKFRDVEGKLRYSLPDGNLIGSNGWKEDAGSKYFAHDNGYLYTNQFITFGPTVQYYCDNEGRATLYEFNGVRKGIDVSEYQKWIDWDSVKASGIEFAMIRVGYRGWGSGAIIEDKYFERNIREAKRVGLKVGVYFYSGAINTSEAIEEAQFVINKVRNYSLDYPIAFDFEDFENTESRYYKLDKNQRTDISIAFLEMVKRHGYTPMMYGNPNYFNNERYFDTSRIVTQYKVWLAHYYWADSARNQYSDFVNFLASGKKTGYSYEGKQGTIDMWQFSSEGIISGINGRVDLNISYF